MFPIFIWSGNPLSQSISCNECSRKHALGRADLRFCRTLLFFDSHSLLMSLFLFFLICKISDPHCHYYSYYYRTQRVFTDNPSSVASLFCRWRNWDSKCFFSHNHRTSQFLYESSGLGYAEVTSECKTAMSLEIQGSWNVWWTILITTGENVLGQDFLTYFSLPLLSFKCDLMMHGDNDRYHLQNMLVLRTY